MKETIETKIIQIESVINSSLDKDYIQNHNFELLLTLHKLLNYYK